MVSGARREGRKQGTLIKTLPSYLWQDTSPCRGEARVGKGYGPFTVARNDCVTAGSSRARLARGGLRSAPHIPAKCPKLHCIGRRWCRTKSPLSENCGGHGFKIGLEGGWLKVKGVCEYTLFLRLRPGSCNAKIKKKPSKWMT